MADGNDPDGLIFILLDVTVALPRKPVLFKQPVCEDGDRMPHPVELFAQVQYHPFRSGIVIGKKLVDYQQDIH
jgi:hypothetical protein